MDPKFWQKNSQKMLFFVHFYFDPIPFLGRKQTNYIKKLAQAPEYLKSQPNIFGNHPTRNDEKNQKVAPQIVPFRKILLLM